MELLQHLPGQQLARQGRADHLLDGQTLGAAHRSRLRDCGRRGHMSLEFVEHVGDAWACSREGQEELVEEIKWEGSV